MDGLRRSIWSAHDHGHRVVLKLSGGIVPVPFGWTLVGYGSDHAMLRRPGGRMVTRRARAIKPRPADAP